MNPNSMKAARHRSLSQAYQVSCLMHALIGTIGTHRRHLAESFEPALRLRSMFLPWMNSKMI